LRLDEPVPHDRDFAADGSIIRESTGVLLAKDAAAG
jgi:hypothetical protein